MYVMEDVGFVAGFIHMYINGVAEFLSLKNTFHYEDT